jgi:predicted acylesterase/phospholipase RssA
MLRALYERGVTPDVIVGTSAGALNGAFMASRPQTVETAEALASVWRGLRRGRVGCPAELAIRILAPLDDERAPWR